MIPRTHARAIRIVAASATIFAVGTGCDESPPPQSGAPAAAASGGAVGKSALGQNTRREVLALIQSSQREGITRRSAEGYMRIWAPDARVVSGRTSEPSAHDHVIAYDALARAAKARSQGKADVQLQLEYDDEGVKVDGQRATVTWTLTTRWQDTGGTSGQERTGERYELRRTSGRWWVTENRFWPLSSEFGGKSTVFDDAKWKALDEAVDEADEKARPFERCAALQDAWRLKEGLELARKLTAETPKRADGWVWRARFADRVREVDETVLAYRRLRELDPKTRVPGWVEVALAKSP